MGGRKILALLIVLCFVTGGTKAEQFDIYQINGGWDLEFEPWISSPLCTIERRSTLSAEEFENEYLHKKPVIFDAPQNNAIFFDHTARVRIFSFHIKSMCIFQIGFDTTQLQHYLEEQFGHIKMMLSSANTYSTRKQYMTLSEVSVIRKFASLNSRKCILIHMNALGIVFGILCCSTRFRTDW